MIKVGDRVKFLSDSGEGIVSKIESSIAYVTVEDGFEIPAMLTDIVAIDLQQEKLDKRRMGISDEPEYKPVKKHKKEERYPDKGLSSYGRISIQEEYEEDEEDFDLASLKRGMLAMAEKESKKAMENTIIISPVDLTDYEIKLCFAPVNPRSPTDSDLKLIVINDSTYKVNITIAKWQRDSYLSLMSNLVMDEDSQNEIATISREALAKHFKLNITLSFFKASSYTPQPAQQFDMEFSPMQFVRRGSYIENEYFDQDAIVFTLASSSEKKETEIILPEIKEADRKPAKEKQEQRNDEPEIIDLHAEEILSETQGMSSGEIISAQIARFTLALDLAISAKKHSKIIFIHGVGKGKLKYEITKLLDNKYKLQHQDASFKEYGYGAIMVLLNKKKN